MPRIHHQWIPNLLRIEKHAGETTINSLINMGHEIQIHDQFGSSQAITEMNGKMSAIHDFRSGGKSVVLP